MKLFVCPRCGSINVIEIYNNVVVEVTYSIDEQRYVTNPDFSSSELVEKKCAECEFENILEILIRDEDEARKLIELSGKARLVKLLELVEVGKVEFLDPEPTVALATIIRACKYREVRLRANDVYQKIAVAVK